MPWSRWCSGADIESQSFTIKAFIGQAIDLAKSGAKVELKSVFEVNTPEELQTRLDMEPALNKAFAGLTPGRQKGYIYHIAAAKQSATRSARVDRVIPRILASMGLND